MKNSPEDLNNHLFATDPCQKTPEGGRFSVVDSSDHPRCIASRGFPEAHDDVGVTLFGSLYFLHGCRDINVSGINVIKKIAVSLCLLLSGTCHFSRLNNKLNTSKNRNKNTEQKSRAVFCHDGTTKHELYKHDELIHPAMKDSVELFKLIAISNTKPDIKDLLFGHCVFPLYLLSFDGAGAGGGAGGGDGLSRRWKSLSPDMNTPFCG